MPDKPNSVYEHQAEVYDLIYTLGRKKDYRAEAEQLHDLIGRELRSTGRNLLDVACGTGLHDQYLIQWYDVTGLDYSPAQLAIARKRLPKLTFHEASMVDFDLRQQYDVVTCLFSSIGHILTLEDMQRAIVNMAQHVAPGGLLIVEPWLHPSQFRPDMVSTDVVRTDEIDVVRMVHSSRQGERMSRLDMHHLVGEPGRGVRHIREVMDVAMYTVDEYLAAFRAAGLDVTHDPEGLIGRGLFIGHKQ